MKNITQLKQPNQTPFTIEYKINTLSYAIENFGRYMTASQFKAYLIIWNQTKYQCKNTVKITNAEFIKLGGKSLAAKPAVKDATNWLHDHKLIFKTLDRTDNINYYCLNANIEGITVFKRQIK